MLPAQAEPLRLVARRWKQGRQQELEEVASREEVVHVDYGTGSTVLWACPLDLPVLVLGHVLLDCVHPGPQDQPWPAPLPQGTVQALPAAPQEHAFRVTLPPLPPSPLSFAAAAQADPGTATPQQLTGFMKDMLALPGLWDGTGCFHRAALLHLPTASLVAMSEDIGRHNCLDRLAAMCALRGLDPAAHMLCITARITASLYCKARRAGFTFILSRAAVTSAAVQKALAQDVTLVGYCRDAEGRCTVFADNKQRVIWHAEKEACQRVSS